MRMVLLLDSEAWSDTVLEALENARASADVGELDDFLAYLITRADLRALIEAAYESAARVGGRDPR